jgi:D-ala D-ala ligase C-terminus
VTSDTTHLIGLLLGTEEDWPTAFETLVARLGPITDAAGRRHHVTTERVTIEPFDLRDRPRHDLVIDRLAYWYFHPREWLKKVALMDDVYLLNSPFTFQSMEKHAAYCAMIRLGLKVPPTVLVPYKDPPENSRFQYTAERYNRPFDLAAVAESVGYPLFMKPYDGGQWVGVSRIRDAEELQRAYDASGRRLMHLQASVEGYDVFARSLSIGPETMVMKFRPELPMHDRYAVEHDFLSPEAGEEVLTISRLINAFFRWEFNSCECLVRGTEVHPIDYANASPDVALTSLHYYFPWAIKTLLKWTVFCVVTGRRPKLDLDTRRYFEIGDREDLSYLEKLRAYRRLADEHFEAERYHDFCASRLAHVDELVLDWVASAEFDRLLVATVRATYPEHEHERFVAHLRGLTGLWVREQGREPVLAPPG